MSYMDKFHTEPKEWQDLFDYLAYSDTLNAVEEYIRNTCLKKE